MSTVTPTVNSPQAPLAASVAAARTPASVPTAPVASAPAAPAAKTPDAPASSTTVTLSPQGLSAAAAAASHPTTTAPSAATASTATTSQGGSIYDALKNGITAAVTDVEDAIAGGAHAVVDGVETAVSTVHDVAKGALELPFALASKACDAVGAAIDLL